MHTGEKPLIGGESIPKPVNRNSLQELVKLKPRNQCHEWNIFAYVLNRDMIHEDGTLDELYGMLFPLGSFADKDDADKEVERIIEKTGCSNVFRARYARNVPLTTKIPSTNLINVPVDDKGKLIKLENQEFQQEKEQYEKRIKLEKELIKEAEEETNPDSIEYYKRQCYLAIKHVTELEALQKKIAEVEQNYQKRAKLVKEHYQKHPNHDQEWLPYIKETLTDRGELQLYHFLESGYQKYREQILK